MNKSENVINKTSRQKNVLESEIHEGGRGITRAGPQKILVESEVRASDTQRLKEEYFKEIKSSKRPPLQEKPLIGKPEAREKSQNSTKIQNKSYLEAITFGKVRKFSGEKITNSRTASPHVRHQQEEIKLTKSDCRKIHINEILKGHAQKVETSSSKAHVREKEKNLQGIAELLLRASNVEKKQAENEKETAKKILQHTSNAKNKNHSNKAEDKSRKNEADKKDKNIEKTDEARGTKNENEREKNWASKDVLSRETGERENSSTFDRDAASEKTEKKTEDEVEHVQDRVNKALGNKWMEYPQSKELETRLQGLWKESLFFKDSSEDAKKGNENFEQDKMIVNTTVIDVVSEERLINKRVYTDRLSLIRNALKNENKEAYNEMIGIKMLGISEPNLRETVAKNFPMSLSMVKDPTPINESLIKPRPSRSAELRDLVNHAVRDHKIFCIFDNHWYIVRPVREELLNRGWLEVIPDRRLIPRRRPPPTGPVTDREKTVPDRNCNTIEAILAAKETFVNELEETVSKSPNLKWPAEKLRNSLNPPPPQKKASDLSLKDSDSSFRICPPNREKKKNNFEIREFVTKCQSAAAKTNEKDKEKSSKSTKEKGTDKKGKKSKESGIHANKNRKGKAEEKGGTSEPTPLNPGLQTILDTVNDHKKTIHKALTEGRENSEETSSANDLSPRFDVVEEEKEEETRKKMEVSQENLKVVFKENEAKAISKIIQATNAKIHFMWLSIKPAIHLKCFNYSPEIINKFQKTSFCTKIGLWNHLNNIQWHAHEVHFPAKSPRMYNTGEADDLQAFFQDFQLTACIGMLKWLADTFFDRGIKAVQTKKGKVPLKAFEFAIKQCERYMRFKDNEDLSLVEEPRVLQEEWNTFLQWFYTITNDHGKLQESSSAQLMVVYTKAVETLRIMKKHWPEIDIDGRLNIWIMKPYCASCGRGIFMTNNVYYIGQHSKYIVQKYIEKPLLIYNTKFDIRQWFMITKLTPLEIWMYKECYLRFCTQPFALRNLHESVHLSNNSVQRKYVNRYDNTLPDQNMWDSNTFQMYLNTIGHPNAWNEVIYPGMRDAIVSVMLSAQDTFDGPRKSWFEVYGADFMLSANVKDGPWLIEINENPAMDPSTKVTARLCPQMLRDVIKVVVDKRTNKNASTGQWELVYRQNYSPSFATVDLDVKGRKIARVPTTMKIEFSQTPTTAYEVVKSLTQSAPESGQPLKEPPDPKKLDPLYILKKEHEKFRRKCPIENAKEMIDRILLDDGGKNLKRSKETSESGGCVNANHPHYFMQKKSTASATNQDPIQKMTFQTKTEPGNYEKSQIGKVTEYKKTGKNDDGNRKDDLFKFTRFYKV